MRKINNIKLFVNDNNESYKIEKKLKELLKDSNFNLTDNNYDLAISIGGDGSFLRMVNDTSFNSDIYYIGINTGTLGFLQEIRPENIEEFVNNLNKNKFKTDRIGTLEITIYSNNDVVKCHALNELVIRDQNLCVSKLKINVDNKYLETLVGDGVLINTSVGSSAYNISLHGSLIYNTLHTIQVTPIAPINTQAYRNLLNSLVLPENLKVDIYPIKKDLTIVVDGKLIKYNNVDKIECSVKNKKIKFLRMKEYNYIDIINEKFLTDK